MIASRSGSASSSKAASGAISYDPSGRRRTTSTTSDSEWPTESTSLNNEPESYRAPSSSARSLSDGECSSGPETLNCPTESGPRSLLNSKRFSTRRLRRKPRQCCLTLPEASNCLRQNWVKDITLSRRRFTQNGESMFSRREEKQQPKLPFSRSTCDRSKI